MKPIIEVKNLSKKYRLGETQPYYTLRDSVMELIKNPVRVAKAQLSKDEFWALKDINFSVNQGEVVGIIGKNGAGKSTLLKILSQITPPTEGEVILRGRVGSLLEVGTGFSPELTGRENIYLNGAVLGMKKSEVKSKFDEIVDFAEVEKFLDTPLKRYSSGMYMRLAFAVAAHLEPEILIVDEVLAVGDAEFQKKCLGKMGEVASEGRTVLFVSHNMGAVRELCGRGILLNNGKIAESGEINSVLNFYQQKLINKNASSNIISLPRPASATLEAKLQAISIEGEKQGIIDGQNDIYITLEITSLKSKIEDVAVRIAINTPSGMVTRIESESQDKFFTLKKGKNIIKVVMKKPLLPTGSYGVDYSILNKKTEHIDQLFNFYTFEVTRSITEGTKKSISQREAIVAINSRWI